MLFNIEQGILAEETLANLWYNLPNPPMFRIPPSKVSLHTVPVAI